MPDGQNEADAAGAAAAAAAATLAAAPAAAWFAGADPELVGHIQNKGWHDKPANVAALEAIKAHREAERHIGVPADQILRVPKDAADEAGWNAVHSRLGKPAAATEYDISAVKFADGTDLSGEIADFVKATAFELNLPKDSAARLASSLTKYLDGASAAEAGETAAQITEQKAILAREWGNNQEANLFIAKQAAAKLGVSPEAVAALEATVGYAETMKLFQKVGTAIGEDKFIASNGGLNSGILTREQATARKAELMADSAWTKRYLDGDAQANRELQSLLVVITGESGNAYERA